MSFQYLKRGALHLARTHNLARTRQALAILASSAAIGAILAWLRVPAALLLGPMLAGIAIAAGGSTARVPNAAFLVAQGIIGCMIAKVVPLSIAGEILGHWPVFVFGVLAVIASSALLGWLMTRTAYLATSPGGADSVAIIAASSKVDVPFVMAMQTTRLLALIVLAPVIMRCIAPPPRSRYP
jgi:membrane AbrB-like protein